jgi:hypothetical protein
MKRGARTYPKGIHEVLILFCILLFTASCNSKEKTHKIDIINGVKVVENYQPKWGNELKIELEFVRKVGGLDTKDENYIFHRPFDLVQDQDGYKYVLVVDDYCIRKYDSDWKYLKRFGRKGQGPSEILRSFGLAIDKNSNLYVIDNGNRKVQKISPDGTHLGSYKFPYRSQDISCLDNGNLVLTARTFYSNETLIDKENPTMLALVNPKGEIFKEFVQCKIYKEIDLMYDANRVNFDIDENNNIYVVFEHQNRIEKYSSNGDLVFSSQRSLNYEIEHEIVHDRGYPVPKLTFVSVDIGIDYKGRSWVTTFDVQPENQGSRGATLKNHRLLKFEIYDNEGILISEMPIPIEFYKKRIYGNTLYLIDPYFEACVYEYKIIEK